MRNRSSWVIMGLLLLGSISAYADTVYLLNGNIVEGKITEQTVKYIKIETADLILTYYTDEIKNIHRNNSKEETGMPLNFKPGKWSMTMTSRMEGMPPEMIEAMNKITPEMKAQMMAKMKDKMQDKNVSMDNIQGMFDPGGTTMTITKCVSKNSPLPYNMNNSFCRENHEIDGNTYRFTGSCNMGKITVESSGYMTYNPDSMVGHVKSSTNMMDRQLITTVDFSGKYLGSC